MKIRYQGSAFGLYKICIKNLFWQILTLMIYTFWAKTNLRKYIYSNINIEGDNLEYCGTGSELFRGFLKASFSIFIFSAAVSLINIFLLDNEALNILSVFLIYIVVFAMIFYSRYLAVRYRLSRTSWRAIRLNLSGSAKDFMMFKFARIILDTASLGFLYSRSKIYTRSYYINNISIGSQKFHFSGHANYLDKIHIITYLLAPFTLFLSRLWYAAALKNYLWQSTRIGYLSFATSFSAGKIFRLYFGNLLIIAFTFGLGLPIVLNRNVRFLCENLTIIGNEHQVNLLQSYYDSSAVGEGINEIMEGDLGFDFGIL